MSNYEVKNDPGSCDGSNGVAFTSHLNLQDYHILSVTGYSNVLLPPLL